MVTGSKTKKIKRQGRRKRREGESIPVRAAIITDEHADGRSKKVDERAREYPMETLEVKEISENPKPLHQVCGTYPPRISRPNFVTFRYGCCLFRSQSPGPGRP